MALNFLPLKAYLTEKDRNVDAQVRAGQAIGGLANAAGEVMANRIYNKRKEQFFNSMGDGDIRSIEAQIKQIDARIEELKNERTKIENEA